MKAAISVFLALVLTEQAHAAQVDPALVNFAQGRTGSQSARVVLVLRNHLEGVPVPRRYDSPQVLVYLKALSSQAINELRAYLGNQPAAPRSIRLINSYWINSTVSADVTPEGLRILANAPSIGKIYANRRVKNDPDRRGNIRPRPNPTEPLTYNFGDTDLDKLMRAEPRINGSGVILGHMDSGVDGNHPALQGKIFKFWDSVTKKLDRPFDNEQHGTHTAGTMVGGDRSNTFIGVAPGAKLITAAGLSDFDGMLASMQFLLDPDGNGNTHDQPRAINNSWNSDGAPDTELFYTAIGAWEAAGILPVFSAGNSGPNPRTISVPHEHPATFAVAATGKNGLATDFSSRGPALFHGKEMQKPDISAPGDNIRSSLPNGQFGEMSGTSMSTPHVTGTVALLLQVDPRLSPDQLRRILVQSSRAVDENGREARTRSWNPVYGMGRLNIFNAVQMARRVDGRRLVRGSNPLDQMGMLFSSREDSDAEEILKEDSVGVDELIKYPADSNGEGWVSPAEIWN